MGVACHVRRSDVKLEISGVTKLLDRAFRHFSSLLRKRIGIDNSCIRGRRVVLLDDFHRRFVSLKCRLVLRLLLRFQRCWRLQRQWRLRLLPTELLPLRGLFLKYFQHLLIVKDVVELV